MDSKMAARAEIMDFLVHIFVRQHAGRRTPCHRRARYPDLHVLRACADDSGRCADDQQETENQQVRLASGAGFGRLFFMCEGAVGY